MSDEYMRAALGLVAADLQLGRIEPARQQAGAVLQAIVNSPQRTQFVEQEAQAQRLLGVALLRSGDAATSEAHLRRGVSLRESLDDPDSPWLAQARIDLARCLIAQRRNAEARGLIDLAAAAEHRQPKLGESFRRELELTSASLRKAV
jgi:hypothetical protein